MKIISLFLRIYNSFITSIFLLRYALITLLFFLSFKQIANAQENQLIEVSGQVTEQDNKTALTGVSVLIKGTIAGTTTDEKGDFKLRSRLKFPFTLVFSSIGFRSQEFEVQQTAVYPGVNCRRSNCSASGCKISGKASPE